MQIAWLLNIRGNDITFNPVVMSFAFVTPAECHLFIHTSKLDGAAHQHLAQANVILHEYDHIGMFLADFVEALKTKDASDFKGILADPNQLSFGLYQSLGEQARECLQSPLAIMKSIKNDAEIEGLAQAHVRDGAALTAFLHWLTEEVKARPGVLTEYEAAEVLEKNFRAKVPGFVSLSFE
jgi:Xaa-Pro aminopeptidase